MADEVWASTIYGNSDFYTDPLRVQHALDDGPRIVEMSQRNLRGDVFEASEFPQVMVYSDPKKQIATLPHLFLAGDYIGVSELAAEAIKVDEMGACSLYPVAAFQADQTTPISGTYFLINFGNVKSGGFLPEQSTKMRADPFRQGIWHARQTLKNGQLAVSADVLNGPGIWVDDRLEDVFFLSGSVVKALKKKSIFAGLQLRKCTIV
ncbi:MAG: hypothetical protein R8G34_18175 [Paracoccaceae bacterium]|nr:hypothetical protein [Paracoccaceae bacterium]